MMAYDLAEFFCDQFNAIVYGIGYLRMINSSWPGCHHNIYPDNDFLFNQIYENDKGYER